MRKKQLVRLLALLLCLALLPMGSRAAQTAEQTRDNGCPYYIMVNRTCNTVTVYSLDEAGFYSVPERAMICSTAREGYETPLGTFALTGLKQSWNLMKDGSYGQYATQIKGNYLFHSVCYEKKDPSTLLVQEYNDLGSAASMGCVRLQVADAKWIFDNCGEGTLVTIYDSSDPGPLGKPERVLNSIGPQDPRWDPTDPRPENPWKRAAEQQPEPSRLPFTDVSPSAWYYEDVRSAYEQGIIAGTSATTFTPNGRITLAEMAQLLYRMAGSPDQAAGEILQRQSHWYDKAWRWAALTGVWTRSAMDPETAATRLDQILMLYRFETLVRSRTARNLASLTSFPDGVDLAGEDYDAMSWAVGNQILYGDDGALNANGTALRCQVAAFLRRYQNLEGQKTVVIILQA